MIIAVYNLVKIIQAFFKKKMMGFELILVIFLKSGVESVFKISFSEDRSFFKFFFKFLRFMGVLIALLIPCGCCAQFFHPENTNPPVTTETIEKFMPSRPFSEVKNDVNYFFFKFCCLMIVLIFLDKR